jgi:serine/threonine protein kinase
VAFPYIVMEWVEGLSLYEWATQSPRTSSEMLRVLAQLARALAATHAVDCVHRDVKGDNVLVRAQDSHALLMDFGAGDYRGARTLTEDPLPPGTPQYRSPQALRFLLQYEPNSTARYEAGPSDDVYALGVTAYRMVTGTYPPPRVDPALALGPGAAWLPPLLPPRKLATVSKELDALILRMLAEEPEVRGPADELAQALEAAVKSADAESDLPITVKPTHATAERVTRPVALFRPPAWLAVATTGVAVIVWVTMHWHHLETSGEGAQARDGGSTGLADTAPTVTPGVAPPESDPSRIGLDLPKKPLPDQRRPPCEKPEIEINGGCWVILGNATPPCGARSYEWKRGCYWPSFERPRPSTSEQP